MLTLVSHLPQLPGGFVLGYASSITPVDVVNLTNTERAKQGLPPLTINGALTQAAVAKANYMFDKNFWAHIAPDGTTPWTFIKNAGYAYSVAGENLARDFGDSGSMVTAWMNSPTHKDNIVNTKFTDIGIGVVNGKLDGVETTLVVQMFGAPTNAVPRTTELAKKVEVKPELIPTSVPELAVIEVQPVGQPVPQNLTLSRIARPETIGLTNTTLSPLLVSKTLATSMILLIICLLIYDGMVMHKRNIPRSVGKNWAHLTFYSVILMVIVAITQGKVL